MLVIRLLDDVVAGRKSISVEKGFVDGLFGRDGQWPNVSLLFRYADKTSEQNQRQFHRFCCCCCWKSGTCYHTLVLRVVFLRLTKDYRFYRLPNPFRMTPSSAHFPLIDTGCRGSYFLFFLSTPLFCYHPLYISPCNRFRKKIMANTFSPVWLYNQKRKFISSTHLWSIVLRIRLLSALYRSRGCIFFFFFLPHHSFF